jgi:F-box interacting protein
LGKESFQEIPQPDYGNSKMLNLGVLRDCLCIFRRESDHSSIDVWLMKEYGNKDSWIKLIRLPYFGDSSSSFTKILHISEDNNDVLLVFMELDKLKWAVYDCKNGIVKSSKIEDLSSVESKVYVESLISP